MPARVDGIQQPTGCQRCSDRELYLSELLPSVHDSSGLADPVCYMYMQNENLANVIPEHGKVHHIVNFP